MKCGLLYLQGARGGANSQEGGSFAFFRLNLTLTTNLQIDKISSCHKIKAADYAKHLSPSFEIYFQCRPI